MTPLDPARRARRQLVALAATLVLLVAAIALLAARLLTGGTPDAVQPPSPSASPHRSTSQNPPASPKSSAGTRTVVWREVAGVELPFSRTHGPRVTDHGRAAGYSRTREGAALAAVQVLARTSASAGPDVYRPVLAGQLTGANEAVLAEVLDEQYERLRRQAGTAVRGGEPIPGNNATVAGYLLRSYDETAWTALVEVLLTAPDLGPRQVVDFSLAMRWEDGDWRVLAPPNGDWAALARLLDEPPSGAQDYRQVR